MKQKYMATAESLGITISTGTMAKQANGAVTISQGDTTVFVSATAANDVRPDQDFFPLTVDYREKFSAAGRFPGGYFKREGKPSEKEILTSRLCDRPLRPLFPKGFINEVQIIGILLSADLENEPDVLMVNGASAALLCSDIPWNGPIGCVRIAYIDDEFVVNPTNSKMQESKLDLIYVGTKTDMLMIEGSAQILSEEKFCEALEFAHEKIQEIIAAQIDLANQVKKAKKQFALQVCKPEILTLCKETFGERLLTAVFQDSKLDRQKDVDALKSEADALVLEKFGEEVDKNQVRLAFEELQEEVYRSNILDNNKRCDNRQSDQLRDLWCDVNVLPRVHGSALFQRGETQALVIATLGTMKDSQDLDGLTGGTNKKSFILHYNFPPYSVGETGRFGVPGRREIGHGALAERSLFPVIPSEEKFPYAIRLVSEIMESNGSTSMASVCGGCLSLMDAGVPILAPVAGISCGLVTRKENDKISKYVILTDILGAEDHFGDMDFKICGTRDGITGFQLDLKINGLPLDMAKEAVMQNKQARMKILDVMEQRLPKFESDLKGHAPRIETVQIDPEKIGALIGTGGKNIKSIQEQTAAQLDVNESGLVRIFCDNQEAMKKAVELVVLSTSEIEVGKTYKGRVTSIKDFGAFVECLPGKEGLVHISELSDFRVNKTEDVCAVGDEMVVKCIGLDMGKVRLSRKAYLCEKNGVPYEAAPAPQREKRDFKRRPRRD